MADFDLTGGLSLGDLSDFNLEEEAQGTAQPTIEGQDLFTGRYMKDFFGLIPNTIQKESADVLRILVYLTLNAPAKRAELKALLRELHIFLDHMQIQLYAPDIPEEVDITLMNEIYTGFYEKVMVLEEAFKEVNFDLDINLPTASDALPKAVDGNIIDKMSRPDEVDKVITYLIRTNRFDNNPSTSLAIELAERYHGFSSSYSYIKEVTDAYRELRSKEGSKKKLKTLDDYEDGMSGVSSTLSAGNSLKSTLKKVLTYPDRDYNYDEESGELDAMAYLGFPCKVAFYERYFKESTKPYLDKLMEMFLKPSKSKMEQAYKLANKNKETRIQVYSNIFDRKAYICKKNAENKVNSSCLYF